MTSLEKKVRSFLDRNNITLTERQVTLLLLQCAGVERNAFKDAAQFGEPKPGRNLKLSKTLPMKFSRSANNYSPPLNLPHTMSALPRAPKVGVRVERNFRTCDCCCFWCLLQLRSALSGPHSPMSVSVLTSLHGQRKTMQIVTRRPTAHRNQTQAPVAARQREAHQQSQPRAPRIGNGVRIRILGTRQVEGTIVAITARRLRIKPDGMTDTVLRAPQNTILIKQDGGSTSPAAAGPEL